MLIKQQRQVALNTHRRQPDSHWHSGLFPLPTFVVSLCLYFRQTLNKLGSLVSTYHHHHRHLLLLPVFSQARRQRKKFFSFFLRKIPNKVAVDRKSDLAGPPPPPPPFSLYFFLLQTPVRLGPIPSYFGTQKVFLTRTLTIICSLRLV